MLGYSKGYGPHAIGFMLSGLAFILPQHDLQTHRIVPDGDANTSIAQAAVEGSLVAT